MTRKNVLDFCYSARTLAEIKAAMQARSSYLVRHPDDSEIFHLGEMLSMLEDAIKIVGEDQAEPPLPQIETLIAKAS